MVIDEAAAIPLPLVKKLIGPYLVFMASTINGSARCQRLRVLCLRGRSGFECVRYSCRGGAPR